MSKYDIIVLGSGPGGYVTAIRASQLGFKTAVIEKESLGGVCLNWGCIPTKALLKSAQVFEYLKHAEDYGLTVKDADKDFGAVVKRSRGVADGMSKGVQFLMKKNNIDIIDGFGKIKTGKKVDVTDKDGNGWRELLEGAGITSMSLKGSGVVSDNAVFTDKIMVAKMADTHLYLKIESGLGDVWVGNFAIPSVERSGEYNKEENFSITLESAGEITYTAVV